MSGPWRDLGELEADLHRKAADLRLTYRERLLFALEAEPGAGQRRLTRMTGLDRRSVRHHLDKLGVAGLVEIAGLGRYKSKHYRLTCGVELKATRTRHKQGSDRAHLDGAESTPPTARARTRKKAKRIDSEAEAGQGRAAPQGSLDVPDLGDHTVSPGGSDGQEPADPSGDHGEAEGTDMRTTQEAPLARQGEQAPAAARPLAAPGGGSPAAGGGQERLGGAERPAESADHARAIRSETRPKRPSGPVDCVRKGHAWSREPMGKRGLRCLRCLRWEIPVGKAS